MHETAATPGDIVAGVYTSREACLVPNFHPTWIAVGLLALACACEPTPVPPPASTPSIDAQATWTIGLSQTGGLMGVDLEVHVTSGGELVASNRRSGRTTNLRLNGAQIGELGRLYIAAASAEYADSPAVCADCYAYELTLSSGDASRTIRLDDGSLPGTPAEPLIAYLTRLRDDALAPP